MKLNKTQNSVMNKIRSAISAGKSEILVRGIRECLAAQKVVEDLKSRGASIEYESQSQTVDGQYYVNPFTGNAGVSRKRTSIEGVVRWKNK